MPPLLRTLRFRDLLLLFIGSVIGSGIFRTPGPILRQVDGSVGLPNSLPPTPKPVASTATFAMDSAEYPPFSTAGVFFSSSPAARWPLSRALSANILQELFRFLSQDRRSLPS
jgi:hypothetical protein